VINGQTAICDQWENDKSISSIDTGQASVAHGAKTDSDLARPPACDHPAGRTDPDLARPPACDHPAAHHASQGVLTLGAQHATGIRLRSERTRVPVTRSAARSGSRTRLPGRFGAGRRTGDTECSTLLLEDRFPDDSGRPCGGPDPEPLIRSRRGASASLMDA
jgi:hypothetical protein